jgi:hypothetical protein
MTAKEAKMTNEQQAARDAAKIASINAAMLFSRGDGLSRVWDDALAYAEDVFHNADKFCDRCGDDLTGGRQRELLFGIWVKGSPTAEAESEPEMPLCTMHKHLDKVGELALNYGNGCVACSLNERKGLLELLAPFCQVGDYSTTTLSRLVADRLESNPPD